MWLRRKTFLALISICYYWLVVSKLDIHQQISSISSYSFYPFTLDLGSTIKTSSSSFSSSFLIFRMVDANEGSSCTQDDKDAWKEEVFAKYPVTLNECGLNSGTIESVARDCLDDRLGEIWTEDCLECTAQLLLCIRSNCLQRCLTLDTINNRDSFSQNCIDCSDGSNNNNKNCTLDFVNCSGGLHPLFCNDCKVPSGALIEGIPDEGVYGFIAVIGLFIVIIAGAYIRSKYCQSDKVDYYDSVQDPVAQQPNYSNQGKKSNLTGNSWNSSLSSNTMATMTPVQNTGSWNTESDPFPVTPNQSSPQFGAQYPNQLPTNSSQAQQSPVSATNDEEPVSEYAKAYMQQQQMLQSGQLQADDA